MRFLAVALVLAAAAGLCAQPLFEKNARVLFQGDSITDMARGRTADPNHILGHSYVFLIGARQGAAFPEQAITFINRGAGGNELGDLVKRWGKDTLAEKPDVLSILIGINDVGHGFRKGPPVSVENYEATYDRLLASTVAALPNIKLVLCEPFVARGSSPGDRFEEWKAKIVDMQAAVERLAAKYHAPVVHLQKIFDDAAKNTPMEHWIWDGVHPTYAGHQLIADEWQRTYRAYYPTAKDKH